MSFQCTFVAVYGRRMLVQVKLHCFLQNCFERHAVIRGDLAAIFVLGREIHHRAIEPRDLNAHAAPGGLYRFMFPRERVPQHRHAIGHLGEARGLHTIARLKRDRLPRQREAAIRVVERKDGRGGRLGLRLPGIRIGVRRARARSTPSSAA